MNDSKISVTLLDVTLTGDYLTGAARGQAYERGVEQL